MGKKETTQEMIPIFGKPIYVITSNDVTNLVKDSSTLKLKTRFRSSISHLQYFAASAILVKRLEFADDDMETYLVNKDTDVEMKLSKEDIGKKVFLDKDEAELLASEMNEEMKENLHEMATEAMELFHNIDTVISAQLSA